MTHPPVQAPRTRNGGTAPGEIVLVVDDDVDILRAIGNTMVAHFPNLRVVLESGADRALDAMAQHKTALILSDYRMPGMDGVELLTRARTLAPNAVRVLMSAYPDVDLASRAVNVGGVDYFLAKPVTTQTFVDVVNACLEPGRKPASRPRPLLVQPRAMQASPTDAADAPRRLAELDAQVSKLKVLFGLGEIAAGTFQAMVKALDDERAALECVLLDDDPEGSS